MSYVELSRASTVLQGAAMQRITCREHTNAYCTYGWLSSVAVENQMGRPEIEWQISSNGSIRGECLDHMIVLSEAYLRRILVTHITY